MNRISKRLLLPVVALILLTGIVSYSIAQERSKGTTVENPSPYSELLPEALRTTILIADSIECMLIDGWTPEDSMIICLGEPIGEILTRHLVSDSSVSDQFRDLLLHSDSFEKDSIVKECTFIPDFGILFIHETDSLMFSYSMYCNLCRFQTKEDFWEFDGSVIRDSLLRMIKAEFPKDKYIRNITRRL